MNFTNNVLAITKVIILKSLNVFCPGNIKGFNLNRTFERCHTFFFFANFSDMLILSKQMQLLGLKAEDSVLCRNDILCTVKSFHFNTILRSPCCIKGFSLPEEKPPIIPTNIT